MPTSTVRHRLPRFVSRCAPDDRERHRQSRPGQPCALRCAGRRRDARRVRPFGEPTGAPSTSMGLSHAFLVDGRVTQEWIVTDEVTIWKQIFAHVEGEAPLSGDPIHHGRTTGQSMEDQLGGLNPPPTRPIATRASISRAGRTRSGSAAASATCATITPRTSRSIPPMARPTATTTSCGTRSRNGGVS